MGGPEAGGAPPVAVGQIRERKRFRAREGVMRLYRLLLRLYPASFRAEYGEEMCNIFAVRQCKENALGLWIGAILDVLSNAIRVHADILRQDLRWTFRALRQSPGFTLTAVSVAALGMGANTAAFTLLDHVLLRPLPFPHPEKLVMLYLTEPGGGYMHLELSPPNYLDLRAMTHSFEAFSAYSGLSINLSGQGDPQRLNGANLGAGIFQILGAQPALGRAFTPEDERNGTPDSVLLSDHLWRTVFGADPNVLGRTVRLDDQPYTVIGVMPAAFAFPSRDAQLWLPLRFPPFRPTERTNFYLYGVARLRKDVSLEEARADLSVAAAQLERAYPKDNAGIGATAFSENARHGLAAIADADFRGIRRRRSAVLLSRVQQPGESAAGARHDAAARGSQCESPSEPGVSGCSGNCLHGEVWCLAAMRAGPPACCWRLSRLPGSRSWCRTRCRSAAFPPWICVSSHSPRR